MISSNTLTCREVVELVTDYLEEALLPEKKAAFEEHVSNCPGCINYIGQVRQTIAMLHNLTQGSDFPTTKEELLETFREWQKG